ncbi:peroxidase-like [Adelges cooleyi]|uniref:peroxidase-like n=1 Tax=Adelges cooleyi TaxID=133065 RepID=UPI00217F7120|nr:peroxidase-like [Adelges cooleyi]
MSSVTIAFLLALMLVGAPCQHLSTNEIHDFVEEVETVLHLSNKQKAVRSDNTDPNPHKIPSVDPTNAVGLLDPLDIDLADQCFPKAKCDPDARFRSIDGSCNNLRFPNWGQTNVANSRIVQANYSDGISQLRNSVSGNALPNVRHIRTTIFTDRDMPAPRHNLYVMQFGQVIAHDTELVISKTLKSGASLQCCNADGTFPANLPKECKSIEIPKDDKVYKHRCIPVVSAKDTSDVGCAIKPVRQLIGVTSFIDASLLYGSTDKKADELRNFKDGKLRRQFAPNGEAFPPNVRNATEACNVANANTVCYDAGDLRVNQHPDIAVSTTTLLRLHNSLTDELKQINPRWQDERLYQEARRLLIAMYQHVAYNEFVPAILGSDFSRVNQLLPQKNGFDDNYNQSENPNTFTSFTSAAFRAMHSYIQGKLNLVNESRKTKAKIVLSDFFLRTDLVQKDDNYDSFTRGMLTQQAQGQDRFFTAEVSDKLFKGTSPFGGQDLISIDIQRGREYGEPSYNVFRQLCGLPKATSFNEFLDQIDKENVDALASLYENVDDVDFYVGGMLEKSKPGSIFGHTFQCVIGENFFRWKFGDRFYYEFGNQPGSFTLDQLNEIRKTSFALLICTTTNIKSIQRDAFFIPDDQNPLVSCSSIPKLNLSSWKE